MKTKDKARKDKAKARKAKKISKTKDQISKTRKTLAQFHDWRDHLDEMLDEVQDVIKARLAKLEAKLRIQVYGKPFPAEMYGKPGAGYVNFFAGSEGDERDVWVSDDPAYWVGTLSDLIASAARGAACVSAPVAGAEELLARRDKLPLDQQPVAEEILSVLAQGRPEAEPQEAE